MTINHGYADLVERTKELTFVHSSANQCHTTVFAVRLGFLPLFPPA